MVDLCTGHPALRDKNVRLAMAHATDKEKIIEIVMLGLASKGIALIPDGMGAWFNSEIKTMPMIRLWPTKYWMTLDTWTLILTASARCRMGQHLLLSGSIGQATAW